MQLIGQEWPEQRGFLAVIAPTEQNMCIAQSIHELLREAARLGRFAVVRFAGDDPAHQAALCRGAAQRGARGIVLLPAHGLDASTCCGDSGVSVTLYGATDIAAQLSFVCMRDEQAGFALAAHLIERGHKTIVFVDTQVRSLETKNRQAGVARALAEHKDAPPRLLLCENDGLHTVYEATCTLLTEQTGPIAFIARDDYMAVGVMQAVRSGGKKIGQQIAVAGFGNTLLARLPKVYLTTIGVNRQRMAQVAVEQALGSSVQSEWLEPQLIVRASTGVR